MCGSKPLASACRLLLLAARLSSALQLPNDANQHYHVCLNFLCMDDVQGRPIIILL